MHPFDAIASLLQQRFPGTFTCAPAMNGHARGLRITCSGHGGHAFIYEPGADPDRYLIALHEEGHEDNPEVWTVRSPQEVLTRLQPWAFRQPWGPPAPIDPAGEKKRHAKLAAGLLARDQAVQCRLAEAHREILDLLTDEGKRRFEEDRAAVCPARIVRQFPFDAAGRLALKSVVMLAQYPARQPPGGGRDLCLAAVGPERRSEPQEIRVKLLDLIVANQTHRWERWRWTAQTPPASEKLGTASAGDGKEARQAAQSLQRLDEGRLEEALGLYDVRLSEELHRLLGGERIAPPACCAHPDAEWTSLLVETLRQSAPWLLPQAVAEEAARLTAWASQKKGRPHRPPVLKLVIFPGQFHARKASLMLVGDKDGRHPRFEIQATASNARLHDTAWKRPITVDFARHGIAFPDETQAPPDGQGR